MAVIGAFAKMTLAAGEPSMGRKRERTFARGFTENTGDDDPSGEKIPCSNILLLSKQSESFAALPKPPKQKQRRINPAIVET